jgi:hypothetical protein
LVSIKKNDFIMQQKHRTVKEFGKFDLVEVWIPNIEKTKIQLISHCSKIRRSKKFYEKTYSQTILDTGEGLAGKFGN